MTSESTSSSHAGPTGRVIQKCHDKSVTSDLRHSVPRSWSGRRRRDSSPSTAGANSGMEKIGTHADCASEQSKAPRLCQDIALALTGILEINAALQCSGVPIILNVNKKNSTPHRFVKIAPMFVQLAIFISSENHDGWKAVLHYQYGAPNHAIEHPVLICGIQSPQPATHFLSQGAHQTHLGPFNLSA